MLKMWKRGMEKLSQQLNLEFNFSPANYNFELGLPLEASLRSFFRPYFPPRYGFGSGYLVDQNEKISSQCDWIVYDAINCPPLLAKTISHDGMEWFPYDSAFGTIEVKRTLDEDSLAKAISQIICSKGLTREPADILRLHPFKALPQRFFNIDPKQILKEVNTFVSGIYAYSLNADSPFISPQALIDHIFSKFAGTDWNLLPEFIAVHGRYYIRKCQVFMTDKLFWKFTQFPKETNGYTFIDSKDFTSGMFYFDLLTQFANMDLSATYQISLMPKFFNTQQNSQSCIGKLFPGMKPLDGNK